MSKKWQSCVAGVAALLAVELPVVASASTPKKSEPRMRGNVTYTPIPFEQIAGWAEDDHLASFRAFQISCERLLVLARERTKGKVVPGADMVRACEAAKRVPGTVSKAGAKAFFEAHFTPNRIEHSGREGLLTGYYEPVMHGSRTRDGAYQTPIYRRPPELVTLIDETRASKAGALTHGRRTEKGFEPFFTRAEIEQGALKGKNLELIYFADPVEVFFMHIQGSARVQLTDGTMIRIQYDGKNGHPYSSIGRYLIETGMLAADKVSLTSLRTWLRSDKERGDKVMWQNASFVFFKEQKQDADKGPLGALGVPLTSGRSIAVDPAHHPLGTPIFVMAEGMQHAVKSGTFARLMIAQDVGSAIKGPERGDLYFGSGDEAGKIAGSTRQRGTFIVLRPNTGAHADAGKPAP